MGLIGQQFCQLTAHNHDPLMGAIGFIGRKHINIWPHIPNIWDAMGRITDPIHTDKRPAPWANAVISQQG